MLFSIKQGDLVGIRMDKVRYKSRSLNDYNFGLYEGDKKRRFIVRSTSITSVSKLERVLLEIGWVYVSDIFLDNRI